MRNKTNAYRALSIVAVVAVLGAACSKKTETPSSTVKTVKIAEFGALTGAAAQLVLPGFQAVQLAFEQANAGKFGKLPVKVVVEGEDTQGDPTQAPPLATKVANDQSFIGVIGPNFSGESLAVGPTLDGAGIPFVTGSATNATIQDQGWTHWFRAQANDNSQGPAAGDYIAKVLKPACAYVTSDDSAYGKALGQIVQTTVTKDGTKVVAQLSAVQYLKTKDFSALITKIKASKCTAVFYGGYSSEAPLLRKQMTEAGLQGVTLVGGDGIEDSTFTKVAGAAGEGTIASCPCGDITKSTEPAAATFIADYTAKWNAAPGIYAADYYDIAMMYINALKAGNTTRQSITDFFGTIDYKGLSKEIAFQSNHDLNAADVKIYFWKDEGGTWTYLGLSTDLFS